MLREEGNQSVTNCHALKIRSKTTEISKAESPDTFDKSKKVAVRGGSIAGNARKELEAQTKKKVISSNNAEDVKKLTTTNSDSDE